MEGPTRCPEEERAHTAGAGLPAAGGPQAGEEALPRSRGALSGGGAEESYPAITTPRGTGREVQDRLLPAPPPPPAADSEAGGEGRGAKWSPGQRDIVRGPELWKLLKERLKDPNQTAFRSAWHDVKRYLELGILMDMRVLGHIWPGQIIGRDPRIEEWAAATAPNVGALQKLLSGLEDQQALWLQIRAYMGTGVEASKGGGAPATPSHR